MVVLFLAVCVSLLSACSRNSEYKWEPGYISGPEGLMDVTEFKGGQHHGDHGYHTGWRKD